MQKKLGQLRNVWKQFSTLWVGWLFGWLVGWLVGWSTWLVGRLGWMCSKMFKAKLGGNVAALKALGLAEWALPIGAFSLGPSGAGGGKERSRDYVPIFLVCLRPSVFHGFPLEEYVFYVF